MKLRYLALGMVLFLAACREREPPMVVPIPDELTLYSLDPVGPLPASAEGVETFNGYKVLGKVVITDPQERRDIVMAINRGIAEGGQQYKCFDPRHGLHLVTDGKNRDLLICFQCGNFYYYPQADGLSNSISSSPQALLNQVLKKGGIPLDQEKLK
jgi:hypothetical protein